MGIPSIASTALPASASPMLSAGKPAGGGGSEFGRIVQDILGNEAAASRNADAAIKALASGKAESLHQVGLAVAQADLQFRLVLELRNRLTEAYQEVMRMQV